MLELLASEYRMVLQDVLAIALVVAAFIWGGAPERAVAASWFLVFKGSSFIKDLFWVDTLQLMEVDLFLASTDLVAGFLFVGIALYANRNYTLWVAAMQVLAIAAHLARGLVESISPIGYVVMVVAPGWLQLIFIGAGIVRHTLRERKFGPYRDWRISRSPSGFGAGEGAGPFQTLIGGGSRTWRDDLK